MLASPPRPVRLGAATILPALLYLPFLVHGDADSVPLLALTAVLGHFVVAAGFEAGFDVRGCIAIGAVYGLMFIWFQQAVLL